MAAPNSMWSCLLRLVSYGFLLILILAPTQAGRRGNVEELSDIKEFKKLIRVKTNVLILFTPSLRREDAKFLKDFDEVAETVRGLGTLVTVDCSEAKKLCKYVKVLSASSVIKHYKDGEFNKDYDRALTYKSMMNFMKDPTGEMPWDEDETAQSVLHIEDATALAKLMKREKQPILIMFYAPWCGFCKKLKPEFAVAATLVKNRVVLAGMDVNKPENSMVNAAFNITGYPTLLYFERGAFLYKYGGENTQDGIVKWLEDPKPPQEVPQEAEWSGEESDWPHQGGIETCIERGRGGGWPRRTRSKFCRFVEGGRLTSESPSPDSSLAAALGLAASFGLKRERGRSAFSKMRDEQKEEEVFYAPWCGHCKKMKPELTQAAATLKELGVEGTLAAVDTTKENALGQRFDIKGFPTTKYFADGEAKYTVNDRTADAIVEFMKDPKEPPPPPPPEPAWSEVLSDVVHLTDDDFRTTLKRKKHALVMFYAPWCGHCKKAKPEFQTAAAKFAENPRVAFAAVDCTVNTETCKEYGVTGYPTMKYFSYYKTVQDYMGGREEKDFVLFMTDPSNPMARESPPPPKPEDFWKEVEGSENVHHLTADNFDAFVEEHGSTLVMFYAPWCGHCKTMKPGYSQAATLLKEQGVTAALAAVDATAERELATRFEVKGFPTLKYFGQGAPPANYDRGRTAKDLIAYMSERAAPVAAAKKEEL
ncbi:PREDICTED: protein disulfide-isomerase A5-like [Priapulus caudatus]|uniref:Protein disulfide-isomerase A5-like n=1 Tax=Priapulus caudatus TaxID=37621 RepID=A0ABM1EI28_PRICU|nr:PREDICTED: protein disulfide-isomerase A5-like [Priapulus caudatus]